MFCLMCNKEKFIHKPYHIGRSNYNLFPKEMEIQICISCNFGRTNPLPDEKRLDVYYETDDYYNKVHPSVVQLISLPDSRALSQYDSIASYIDFKRINNLLDFGAGSAVTSRTIKIRHPYINATVIELSERVSRLLKADGEINQVHKEISSVTDPQDLIIISQTLEHLLHPDVVIKEFRRLLVKGGYLFIEVPNCPFPIYYDCKSGYQPHLSFFTAESFIQMAKTYDFELIWVAGMGVDIKEWRTKNRADIVRRTGHCYALNPNGTSLRVLLRKR